MNAPLKHNSSREAPNDSDGKRANNAGRAMPTSSPPSAAPTQKMRTVAEGDVVKIGASKVEAVGVDNAAGSRLAASPPPR